MPQRKKEKISRHMKLCSDLPTYYSTNVQSGYNKKRLNSIASSSDEVAVLVRENSQLSMLLHYISIMFFDLPREVMPTLWLKVLLLVGAHQVVEDAEDASHVVIYYKDEARSLPLKLFKIDDKYAFDYQYVRYVESDGQFVRLAPMRFEKTGPLSIEEVTERQERFGDSSYSTHLSVSPMKALLSIAKEQLLLSPLIYFEAFCLLMWGITKYIAYSIVIVLLLVVERSVAIKQSLQTWSHLNAISSNADEQEVDVIRRDSLSGKELRETIRAKQLVPGDHVIVRPNMLIPCDCVLIKGEVIADVSFVTGESKAVRCNAVPPVKNVRVTSVASSLLLCGSKALRTRAPGGSADCRAIVVANGFHTLQGNFLLSVLFRDPTPAEQRFEYWFVQSVAVLLVLALLCMIYTYVVSTSILQLNHVEVAVRVFDLVTDALPPALPLSLSIAALAASLRLPLYLSTSRSGRPTHVLAGLVNKVVLDKTNTVTTTDMSVTGVLIDRTVLPKPPTDSILETAMAACNYLAVMDSAGGKKIVGDPLEIALMESIGWEIDPDDETYVRRKPDTTPVSSPREDRMALLSPVLEQSGLEAAHAEEINTILRTRQTNSIHIAALFPFNPITMRMSVVARLPDNDKFWAFSKGAYEQIIASCDPDSVPFSLSDTYERLSGLGYRIIAYAARPLSRDMQPETVGREDVESQLKFCGIVLLSNELHPSSKEAIRQLRESNIQVFLCTGDSSGTAVAVARQAGITGALNGSSRRDNFMYKGSLREPLLESNASSLVMSRMTPDDKALFVESLAVKEQIGAILMCGDGPNDANALCAADVGVVVNASPNPLLESAAGCMACLDPEVGLRAVVEIITLGRSAIAVILCIAEIVISYAVIEGTCVVLNYSLGDNLTDPQYAIVDMFLVLPTVLLLATCAKPARNIEETRTIPPFRVRSVGLIFHCALAIVWQMAALEILKAQDWYVPFRPCPAMLVGSHGWSHSTDDLAGYENTVLFTMCCFQCVFLMYMFAKRTLDSWCRPYREASILRTWMRFIIAAVVVQFAAITVLQDVWLGRIIMDKIDLVPLQGTFVVQLLFLMGAQVLVCQVWEFGIIPRLEREIVMSLRK